MAAMPQLLAYGTAIHKSSSVIAAREQPATHLPALASILGHASLRCVTRYVHPTAEHQAQAMRRYEQTLKPALRLVK
jgi:hypothetical protein